MKNLLVIAFLMLFSFGLSAQDEVKKEKLSIKIVKEEDGKREVIEKAFDSKEEMKAWLKENGHHAGEMAEDHHKFKAYRFHFDDEEGEKKKGTKQEIEIIINEELNEGNLREKLKACEGNEFFFKHEFSEDKIREMKEHAEEVRIEMKETHLNEVMERVEVELEVLRESLDALDEETMSKTLDAVRKALEDIKMEAPHIRGNKSEAFRFHHKMLNNDCDKVLFMDGEEGNRFFSKVVVIKCHANLEELDEDDKVILDKSGIEVSSKELELQDLSIYPNPNDGNFNLKFELPRKGKTSVRVINNKGEIVLERNLGKAEGVNEESIELSDQPAGIYYLQILQDKSAITKKVVVN